MFWDRQVGYGFELMPPLKPVGWRGEQEGGWPSLVTETRGTCAQRTPELLTPTSELAFWETPYRVQGSERPGLERTGAASGPGPP